MRCMRFQPGAMFVLMICGMSLSSVQAAEPKPAKLHIFPADVHLKTSRDRQSLVVQAEYANGITRDVTTQAKYTFANPALVKFDKQTLYPAADGRASWNCPSK